EEAIDILISQVIETFDDISHLLDTSVAADVCSNTIESLSAIIKATRINRNDTWLNALRSCIDQRNNCVSLLDELRRRFLSLLSPPRVWHSALSKRFRRSSSQARRSAAQSGIGQMI